MKTKLIMTIGTIFLLMAISCKKEDEPAPTPEPTTPTGSSFFIEGRVDGVMHRAEYICPYSGCDMSTGNYSEFMNSITMQRTTSATNPIGWDIRIDGVNLDSWIIPASLNASNLSGEENLSLSYYSGPHESDNNFLVDGVVLGENSFTMNVTSKSGDILQGTFSGLLRNGSDTDATVTVTEGKFKIKLIRI